MAGKNKKSPAVAPGVGNLKTHLIDHLTFDLAKDMYSATQRDKFNSVVFCVRENIVKRWINTQQQYYDVDAKRVYYLSLEFLLGRLLKNYMLNLGVSDEFRKAVDILGLSFEDVLELEWDAGLGNGGLGRLAACFLDSLASLQFPGYGYGIRYEYGIFTQKIRSGFQVEAPDNWLRYGNPWEFPRPELLYHVRFGGRVNMITGSSGRFRMEWLDTEDVMAMAYDYPIPGFRNETVNTLRLWAAKSTRDFNLEYFNSGNYIKAVEDKNSSENISKVLYPNDQSPMGRELRLKQQYFFVSATLMDIIRRYRKFHRTFREFPDKVAVQLNDTHPAIAVAELMRILVDENRIPWDDAWEITTKTFAYTNHTVLPEALETWPEGLLSYLLPRHLQIIQEIDRRFLIYAGNFFHDTQKRKGEVALITGKGDRSVHMARLAIVGSHSVNGVSALHTDILKKDIFKSFYIITPGKFRNITNGIAHRRWMLQANPLLANLITSAIGDKWLNDLEELKSLEPFAKDREFCRRFRSAKNENKKILAGYLKKRISAGLHPEFFLDCHIKRFHEYKRQILNLLHVITLYNRIRGGKVQKGFTPRAVIFAGKSAPGYFICKLIIKMINNIRDVISADSDARDKLQVVFVPNYGVTLAEYIIPAAELSEQISTAGYEASGTGNMKFALNGALTIGTLDGANIEIRNAVGHENFFLFGHTADEVKRMRKTYNPLKYYEQNHELRQALNQLMGGFFSVDNPGLFNPVVKSLLERDSYFVMADYDSYIKSQEEIADIYRDRERWTRMSVLNVARCGSFSSDRAVREYAEAVWHASPVSIRAS